MIFYLGHKEEKVDIVTRVNKNREKSWKYGYNKEHDVIIISKDGTLGDIFYVNGIYIGLPDIPKDRKQIINWDKTEKNQKWKRKEMPKGLNARTQKNKEYKEYIEEEYRRRKEGVFVYIKGQPVYLPGSSYFFFQWNKLDEGYPTFRVIQNELMIFWAACVADNRCYGIDYVKNRRFGWTALCNNNAIEEGTRNENKLLGMISKTGADAKSMFGRCVRTFKKLPSFFMPVWDGTTTPKTELAFTTPTRKRRAEDDIEEEEGLDTFIRWFNTVMNAMDGEKVYRSYIDEGGKFPPEVPIDEYWRIVKTSHRQGSRIVGKCMMGSTVNSKKKGGDKFERIYKDSNPLERNKNGQTKSGLYRILIPTKYCLEGYFDEYGFSIVDDPEKPIKNDLGDYVEIGSWTHLQNDLEALKDDPEAENEYRRQNPDNEQDAFRDEASDCEFDLHLILEQIDHNNHELNENTIGNDDIERGNLEWKDGIKDSEVIWRPNPTNGRFWIKKGCHPPMEFRNKKIKKWKNGILAYAPTAEFIGCFGGDPYNRDKGVDGRGSKGAFHLVTKTNSSSLPNEKCILEYIDRPKTVRLFFEDVLKAMLYYSIPILGELSNEAFLQHIVDRGYRHFSLNNPFKTYDELSHTEKKLGGAPAQNGYIALEQYYHLIDLVSGKLGVARDNSDRPIGTMGDFPFTRTLKQLKDFDDKKRTKYDACISLSLALLGNYSKGKKPEGKKKRYILPLRRYDNTGNSSKLKK